MTRTSARILAWCIAVAVSGMSRMGSASPTPQESDVVKPTPKATHGAEHGGIEWITNPFPMFMAPEQDKIGLLWLLINFAVLLWILEKLMFSKLRRRTRERHEQVRSELERATQARQQAQDLIDEYRGRLDRLDDEIDDLMRDAKARAQADRKHIIAAAETEAERIKASARAAGEREAQSLQRQIESEVIDRAVAAAERAIKQQFTPDDQRRMVERYVEDVDKTEFTEAAR